MPEHSAWEESLWPDGNSEPRSIVMKSLISSKLNVLGEMKWMSKERGISGAEFPQSDRLQLVLLIIFFAVWGLDSLVFQFSTFPAVLFRSRFGWSSRLFHLVLLFSFWFCHIEWFLTEQERRSRFWILGFMGGFAIRCIWELCWFIWGSSLLRSLCFRLPCGAGFFSCMTEWRPMRKKTWYGS